MLYLIHLDSFLSWTLWTIKLSLTYQVKHIRSFFSLFFQEYCLWNPPFTLIGVVPFLAGFRAVFLWLLFIIIQGILFAFFSWNSCFLDPTFFFLDLLFLFCSVYSSLACLLRKGKILKTLLVWYYFYFVITIDWYLGHM